MLGDIKLAAKNKVNLPNQIAEAIVAKIEDGTLKNDTFLPSLIDFTEKYKVSKATVEKAYNILRQNGFIRSAPGKGYYVVGQGNHKHRILFILNKISSFKKLTFYSFLNRIGDKATVDLQIHHYKPSLLNEIINQSLNKYDFFVLMPHFEFDALPKDYLQIIKRIPSHKLLILDKYLPKLSPMKVVYQDFKSDIYEALTDAKSHIDKYKSIVLIFPEYGNHPQEIILGVKQFGKKQNKFVSVIYNNISKVIPVKETLYIVITDEDLGTVLKIIKKSNYVLGNDIGVISFNETDLKDVLDITVISTDFNKMGETAADLILTGKNEIIRNPFSLIKRGSL